MARHERSHGPFADAVEASFQNASFDHIANPFDGLVGAVPPEQAQIPWLDLASTDIDVLSTLPGLGLGRDWDIGSDDPIGDDSDDAMAGAKPDWATKTGGGGGGKANGKNKTTTDTGTDTTTDTGTDTGTGTGTDTTTDTGTGDPSGTGEVNPGSSDPNTYVSGMDTPDGYNIEITFIGDWPEAFMQAVCAAAERISDLVTGDIASHNGIDDLHIDATVTSLNGYYGYGGYTSLRAGSYLPSDGYLKLDANGAQTMLNYGVLEDLAFHEILHAMGFGLTWDAMGLVDTFGDELRFTGANAIEAYNYDEYAAIAANDPLSLYGVPIEMDGGSGTAGKHWDHDTFHTDIMTGTLGLTNVVSDMTLAALEDMGYETVFVSDMIA